MPAENIVEVHHLKKSVGQGEHELSILTGVELVVKRGETIALVGESGSGKSTLLAILAGLDDGSSGEVSLVGQPLHNMDEEARAKLRAKHVGFVFQSFMLIPTLNALENVELPALLRGESSAESRNGAKALLEQLGLGKRLDHLPAQLSGGEQQRVALARAFNGRPDVLFADEPTGNLDRQTGDKIADLLFSLNREHGTTLIMVTHDLQLPRPATGGTLRPLLTAGERAVAGGSMIARWFWREWRSPSLLIVWLALSLAVACVLALGNISDRMEKGLNQQSREFMAGDRALRSSREVPQAWLEEAQKRGLKVGKQLTFATMTFAGDTPQLANVKAVDDIYPMYGDLQTNPPGLKPQAGSVLLAPRLMALLNLKTGDTIDVGDATLRIAGEVIQEPDSGFNPFQMAPRLMMNLADVDKTGAVQPGSRVTWRYKFGGNENQLDGYEKWLLPQLKPEQRWYGLEQDEGALGRSMERSQQFLLLSALLTLLLAVAAVAVAMNHYCRSRYDLVAILKTLGAGRAQLRKQIVGQWLMVLALSAVTGGAIGLLFENVLMVLLKPVLPAALPPASLWPWLWALGTMTVISLLVGLRPYRLLLATQPLRVLRNDVVANVWPLKFYLPIVSVVVVLLLAGLMGGSMLLWAVLAGAVVLALLCGVLGWMLLNVLRRMTLKSLPLRLAVSRLLRQPWSTLSQLSAFSLSFMLLALLLVLRGDLLDRWQQQLPPESPNYFLINIATEQVEPLKAFLAEHQIVPESFYPVVRARLTAINDKPTEGNEDEALNRELNLTWQNTRPDHNPIVAGNWPPKADEVSMEEGLAKRLNVALGDTVTFMGDTQEFRAKVTSLRKVDWESLRPNFYFIFPEGALDGQPQSWLTSFRWENGNGMLTQLNRQFPTISLLDIGAILKQVGQVLEQVSRALEVMVVLVTACGMLLLLAQVQVGMRQRHQELVVWRTLGAGKKLLRTTLWCEFAMLGFVSGLVAAIGAETALAVLQAKVFDFPWEPDWRLWIVLPCSGALLLSLFGGWLGARLVKGKALFRQFAG